jgi:hypothetical protein
VDEDEWWWAADAGVEATRGWGVDAEVGRWGGESAAARDDLACCM